VTRCGDAIDVRGDARDPRCGQVKRVLVAVVGGLLLLAGAALLVLPGPGFVLVAAGLAVLATQFAWAARPLDYAKRRANQGLDEVATSWVRAGAALLCAAFLVLAGVLEIAGVDLPIITALSAILLIASGAFLLGSIIYARHPSTPPGRRGAADPP
jgi:uncharacterized protein (TIGR02611 family)